MRSLQRRTPAWALLSALRVPDVGASDRVNIIARVFPSSRIVASGPFTLVPGGVMDVTLPLDENTLGVLPARGQIEKQ